MVERSNVRVCFSDIKDFLVSGVDEGITDALMAHGWAVNLAYAYRVRRESSERLPRACDF